MVTNYLVSKSIADLILTIILERLLKKRQSEGTCNGYNALGLFVMMKLHLLWIC